MKRRSPAAAVSWRSKLLSAVHRLTRLNRQPGTQPSPAARIGCLLDRGKTLASSCRGISRRVESLSRNTALNDFYSALLARLVSFAAPVPSYTIGGVGLLPAVGRVLSHPLMTARHSVATCSKSFAAASR